MPASTSGARSRALLALGAVSYAALLLFSATSLRWHSVWGFPSSAGGGLAVLLAALFARSPLAQRAGAQLLRLGRTHGYALAAGAAALHLLAALYVARAIFGGVPNIEDGYGYWLQAQTFAQGRLFQPDPGTDALPLQWVVRHQGRFFGIFPPGFSLLAVPGVWLGAPWAMPPAYGALGLFAVYAFARELGGPTRALAVLALCSLSPQYLLMSGSFLSHAPLFCVLFAGGALLLRACRARALAAAPLALAGGALAALGVLTRPPEGAVLAAVLGLTALWRHRRARTLGPVLLFGAVALAGAALYTVYNRALTGGLRPALELVSPTNRYGFGPEVGESWNGFPTRGHTPWRAMINANFNLAVLNGAAFGWPLPSAAFALLACCFGLRRRFVALGALWLLAIVGVYAPYWYHGVCIGARFYHLMIPWWAWLTVDGLALLGAWLRGAPGRAPRHALPGAAVLAALSVVSVLLYTPRHLAYWPAPHGRAYTRGVLTQVEALHAERALVFLRGHDRVVGPALLLNRWPLEQSPVLCFHDRGPAENALLQRRFPGRAVHYLDVPYPASPLPPRVEELLGAESNSF